MKRIRHITVRLTAIAAGLALGWHAAGLAFPPGAVAADTYAPASSHGETHHDADAAVASATQLVPTGADGHAAAPTWYRGVVGGAAGLFVAAVVLGVPAAKLKTSPPPQPANSTATHH